MGLDAMTLALAKAYTDRHGGGGGASAPDWNENNEANPGYIKNRTHYEEVLDEYVIFEGTLPAFTNTEDLPMQYAIPSGISVIAYYSGSVVATVVGSAMANSEVSYLFDPDLTLIVNNNTMTASVYNGKGNGVLKFVVENFTAVHTLDEKYLPSNVAGMINTKMDAYNPVGAGSFSMGRKPNTVVGSNSHAEGNDATASGSSSHAEGNGATASGSSSHAEGTGATASGDYSHAEGWHTTASGSSSHAEGDSTTASGARSHVEGFFTKASGAYQHAQGKYNIEDSGTYADIIGNGTSSKRSNAATVDWSGNAWYAGDVYVGSTSGTNKDAGSKKLATEEYVNSAVSEIPSIPTALPNPYALTFTGAVTGSYDGSEAVSVEIPSGVTDDHINSLIDIKLGVIENGSY